MWLRFGNAFFADINPSFVAIRAQAKRDFAKDNFSEPTCRDEDLTAHFWLAGKRVDSAGPGSIGSGARESGMLICTMPLPPGNSYVPERTIGTVLTHEVNPNDMAARAKRIGVC